MTRARRFFRGKGRRRRARSPGDMDLHETYMDRTVAGDEFSLQHGEGRVGHSISVRQIRWFGLMLGVFVLFVLLRVGDLQLAQGDAFFHISQNNVFDRKAMLPVRGSVFDRNGVPLAWNAVSVDDAVPLRVYPGEGFSSLLGFARYPTQDSSGNYYRHETEGEGGVEEIYDRSLSGTSGSFVVEKNAAGDPVSALYAEEPVDGEDVTISIDASVQSVLYESIKSVAQDRLFQGGSGVFLDITTGEIIALASYPDFDNNVMTNHSAEERERYISRQQDGVFFNRGVSGLYIPGSTVKPFFAVAALEEGIVDAHDTITSTGKITVQNPYDPDVVYEYKDWRAHGPLTLYGALSQSSNVYFYYIGGGYGHIQEGLGIDRLNFYADIFGLGRPTELGGFSEPAGLVPGPKWKMNHHGEEWRVGDTYNTVIGQYAFQVTPLQLARAVAAIANGGYLLEPHLTKGAVSEKVRLAISEDHLEVVRTGMRRTVLTGTAKHLRSDQHDIAVKTGTAQIGRGGIVNSLLIGFFPHKKPKYAFAIVMERGEQDGAVSVARLVFDSLGRMGSDYL